VALGVILLACIRDAVKVETVDQVKNAASHRAPTADPAVWTVAQAIRTPTFLLLALAMTVVQTVVTTMHSVLVTHVAGLGAGTSGAGAVAMSLLALSGAFAKGATGALIEKVDAKAVMVTGLALQSATVALLCLTATPAWAYAFAVLFGVGWGFSWLSAHVLLLRYFGASIAGEMVAVATMSTTFAVLGPLSAGWVADMTGSFLPIFAAIAVALAVVAITSALFLRAPQADQASARVARRPRGADRAIRNEGMT
jgi:MFS family permease